MITKWALREPVIRLCICLSSTPTEDKHLDTCLYALMKRMGLAVRHWHLRLRTLIRALNKRAKSSHCATLELTKEPKGKIAGIWPFLS